MSIYYQGRETPYTDSLNQLIICVINKQKEDCVLLDTDHEYQTKLKMLNDKMWNDEISDKDYLLNVESISKKYILDKYQTATRLPEGRTKERREIDDIIKPDDIDKIKWSVKLNILGQNIIICDISKTSRIQNINLEYFFDNYCTYYKIA